MIIARILAFISIIISIYFYIESKKKKRKKFDKLNKQL